MIHEIFLVHRQQASVRETQVKTLLHKCRLGLRAHEPTRNMRLMQQPLHKSMYQPAAVALTRAAATFVFTVAVKQRGAWSGRDGTGWDGMGRHALSVSGTRSAYQMVT